MAVQTRSRLFDYFDSLCYVLVRQHIGMASVFTVIHTKGITFENLAPTRVFIKLLKGLTPTMPGSLFINCPSVSIILAREILAPNDRVNRIFSYFYNAEHLLPCLFFTLRDVFQQQHDSHRRYCNDDNCYKINNLCVSSKIIGQKTTHNLFSSLN